jgi:uncharacterized protein YecE (DUF72 family)
MQSQARDTKANARILIGTCNWADHTAFYPAAFETSRGKSRKIVYYAQFFPIVEIDSTFYSLQPQRNFTLWSERTPADFVFNVKAYGELTWHHREDRRQVITPSAETFEKFDFMIQPLRDAKKLGVVHFQFPPWYLFSDETLDYLTTVRACFPHDRVAVEFRHRSWLDPHNVNRTLGILRDHNMTYVMVDEPQVGFGSVPPLVAVTSPDLAMVRFHGRNAAAWYVKDATSSADRFDYLYHPRELAEWTSRIQEVSQHVAELHVMTNNNRQNYAVVNAFDLAKLLDVPLKQPPPPPVLDTMRERDAEGALAGNSPM